MKTKSLILYVLLGASILASGCTNLNTSNKTNENMTGENIGLANPASQYCEENGGTLEIIYDNGESYGMCHFKNGATCEEREFYRKECSPVAQKTGKNEASTGNKIKKTTQTQKNKTSTGGNTKKPDQKDKEIDNKENIVACTADAKQCPDGSYVSRTGPNCEFAKCNTTKTDSGQNDNIDNDDTNIKDMLDDHKKGSGYKEEGLTEDDIDLMEKIIDQLK